MNWLIFFGVAGFLFYRLVLVKVGNPEFWKVAQAHPEEAYSFFTGNDCFVIFDSKSPDGYLADLHSGDLDGPFKLHVPSRKGFVTIYARSPVYQIALEDFIRNFHG